MKGLIILSFLIILISISTRADMGCVNEYRTQGVPEGLELRYQSCGQGLSFYNFVLLDQKGVVEEYHCEKVGPRSITCVYEECTKGEGFFSPLVCEEKEDKEFSLEIR